MDVRLPDGTIISGIPEGTTKAQLIEKLGRNGYDVSGLQGSAPSTPVASTAEEYTIEGGGILANIGAGMNSAYQGAKQLVGMGETDEQIKERRRLDQKLAEGQTGGWLAQMGGELAATAIPVAGAAGGVAKLLTSLPKVGAAIGGLGAVGGRVANLGTVGRGAVEGAVSGALSPVTEDESRGFNTALGGTVGAVLPAALTAGVATKNMVNKGNASNRAARIFERQLGNENIHDIGFQLAGKPQTTLPLSTAALTQNPALASLERGARNRNVGDMGYNQSKEVAEKSWYAVKRATSQADELPQRIDDREAVMQAAKEHLDQFNNPADLAAASQLVSDTTDSIRRSAIGRQNPEVTNLVSQTEQMLMHPDRTAGDYASQYWRLSNIIDSPNTAPETATAVRKLRDAVAQAADEASGNTYQFSDMLTRYKVDQQAVEAAEAAKGVREAFVDPTGIPRTPTTYGDTPNITSSALRKAMTAKGVNQYGDVLEQPTRQGLKELESELARHEMYLPSNSPGLSQLNDPNPLSVISSGRDNPFNFLPLVKGSANWLLSGSRQATSDAADKAMMDPKAWESMMEGYLKSKSPLTPQEYMSRILRQGALIPGRAVTTGFGD
jgi:hypothetical protein